MGRRSKLLPRKPVNKSGAVAPYEGSPKNKYDYDDTQDLSQSLLSADELDDDYTSFPNPRGHSLRRERDHSLTASTVFKNEFAGEKAPFSEVFKGNVTLERYLVESYLRNYKWYNPQRDNPNAPCLQKGWAFFEHFTLPRHFSKAVSSRASETKTVGNLPSTIQSNSVAMTKAPPGEKKSQTKLYHPLSTPLHSLSDWGIGVGMYFWTLASMAVIFLLAGLLNVKNILYYASKEYDPDRFDEEKGGFPLMSSLKYSSVCMTREWVVCVDCQENESHWNNVFANQYYGTVIDPVTGQMETLIHRTTCAGGAAFEQGIWNLATLLFLIIAISAFVWYQNKIEVRLDEGKTTASDYTILVSNPPGDAVDPEEWKEFFNKVLEKVDGKQQQKVTLCTIALGNHRLLRNLVLRRKDLKTLKNLLCQSCELSDMNDEAAVDAAVTHYLEQKEQAAKLKELQRKTCMDRCVAFILFPFHLVFSMLHCIGRSLGLTTEPSQLWRHIQDQTNHIRQMQENDVYEASAVYITFETERAQRTVLKALDAGRVEVWSNKRMHLERFALFRGSTILDVSEADEPDTIRWTDLSVGDIERYLRQFTTLLVTFGMMALSIFTLPPIRVHVNTMVYSIILSTYNMIIPLVVRKMVSFEKHPDEGNKQASLYINIVLFRWVNTVIVTDLTTPFLGKLGAEKFDMLSAVNALLISEMLYSPVLKCLDIGGLYKKHYLAPRAKSQESMYEHFVGGYYSMADRFTEFTKVLFLCIFYSPYYPLIYFFGAGILFVQYWTDKILLMRNWQSAPTIGSETSTFSRRYFATAAIVLGSCSAATIYASFPYTQLCECAEGDSFCSTVDVQEQYSNVTLLNGDEIDSVQTSSKALKFCNQDQHVFPPVPGNYGPDRWMTDSQENLTQIYGWVCFALLILYIIGIFGHRVWTFVLSLWKGVYEPSGLDQHKDFSDGIAVDSFGYIPQFKEPGFKFPFLACDIKDIDVHLIGWHTDDQEIDEHTTDTDPHRSYDQYNLIHDVPYSNEDSVERPVFSIVRQWPPEWAKNAKDDDVVIA